MKDFIETDADLLGENAFGNLYLINEGKDIEVDLTFLAKSEEFAYRDFYHLYDFFDGATSKQLRGITFGYSNKNSHSEPDTHNGTHHIPIRVGSGKPIIPNTYGWKETNKVRVMLLNEHEKDVFDKLKPFFKKYLIKFTYDTEVLWDLFKSLIKKWNEENPGLELNKSDLITLKAIESTAQPRYVKNGGVLQLKLRKNG